MVNTSNWDKFSKRIVGQGGPYTEARPGRFICVRCSSRQNPAAESSWSRRGLQFFSLFERRTNEWPGSRLSGRKPSGFPAVYAATPPGISFATIFSATK